MTSSTSSGSTAALSGSRWAVRWPRRTLWRDLVVDEPCERSGAGGGRRYRVGRAEKVSKFRNFFRAISPYEQTPLRQRARPIQCKAPALFLPSNACSSMEIFLQLRIRHFIYHSKYASNRSVSLPWITGEREAQGLFNRLSCSHCNSARERGRAKALSRFTDHGMESRPAFMTTLLAGNVTKKVHPCSGRLSM